MAETVMQVTILNCQWQKLCYLSKLSVWPKKYPKCMTLHMFYLLCPRKLWAAFPCIYAPIFGFSYLIWCQYTLARKCQCSYCTNERAVESWTEMPKYPWLPECLKVEAHSTDVAPKGDKKLVRHATKSAW